MNILKKQQEYKNIRDYAYHTLKNNILNLVLEPGQRITENELVDILQVSKTPIREALIFLVKEGLVEIFPQSGTFITKIDFNNIIEGKEIRTLVETHINTLAIDYCTEKEFHNLSIIIEFHKKISKDDIQEHFYYDELFHRTIYGICNKMRTFDMIHTMNHDYYRIRILALIDLIKFDQVIHEHELILDALRNKDKQKIIKISNKHLQQVDAEVEKIITIHPSYFTK